MVGRWLVGIGLVMVGFSSVGLSEALFEYKGKTYSENELDARLKLQIFEANDHAFHAKEKIIEDAVLDLYFEEIAKKEGKDIKDVRAAKTDVGAPSDDTLKKFYEENKAKIPYPFEQVKGELVRFVTEKSRQEKRTQIMEEIKKSGSLKSLIVPPVAPSIEIDTTGFYAKGNAASKVKVIEFADYKCPHCKEAAGVFKEVLKKYGDKVQFVFIDFPIMADSYKVAEGAHCAQKQNKYWEYHYLAFEKQGELKNAEEVAKAAAIDNKDFQKCVADREGKAIVEKGRALGDKVGVSGTPTVFINGKRYHSGYTVKDVSAAIDEALANKGAS